MKELIKIVGTDNIGWSISKDRFHNTRAIRELGYNITNNFFRADIILSVWYSYLKAKRFLWLPYLKGKRKIVSVITNDIAELQVDINKEYSFVDYWIYTNSKHKEYLLSNDIRDRAIFYNPYYVDENIFRNLNLNRLELSKQLNIDYSLIKDKFLLGSIQKDSVTKNLRKPKWQKGPQMLLNILKELEKDTYTLILAGPCRHFIVNECEKQNIPYIYIGDKNYIDKLKIDNKENNLEDKKVNLLYNLIDLYIISSASEGGPKAGIEAPLTKTAVISTDVGFTTDILSEYSIYKDHLEAISKIQEIHTNKSIQEKLVYDNYNSVSKLNNFEAYKARINYIFQSIIENR